MRRIAAAVSIAIALAGCAAPPPSGGVPLRNPTAPIASQVDATLARLSGDWRVSQGAGIAPGTKMRIRQNGVWIGPDRLTISQQGQGRFTVGDQEIWVYWLDGDNRTAALGDPQGRRVWIMDRAGQSRDRLRAARDILKWYGYDLNRLDPT